MSAFKDQSFNQRFAQMGDEAEGHFETYAKEVLDRSFVRYGLARPPIQMHALPARIRYTPDYLMSKCFVEVQGLGRDQQMKVKHDKLNSLRWWNDFQRPSFDGVRLYIWDSHHQRECWFHLSMLDELLADGKGALGCFEQDRKPYIHWNADDIFEAASCHL